MRKVNITKVAH